MAKIEFTVRYVRAVAISNGTRNLIHLSVICLSSHVLSCSDGFFNFLKIIVSLKFLHIEFPLETFYFTR